MSDLETRVAALEAFVASLRGAIGGGAQHRTVHAGASAGEVADDELMAKPWADMEIRKDPPRTTQPSHAGRRMSECTAEYLNDYASFHDWKAKKGREEDPPRLNNKGKPWYESDELTAKVARGWAKRVGGKPAAKLRPTPAAQPEDLDLDTMPF